MAFIPNPKSTFELNCSKEKLILAISKLHCKTNKYKHKDSNPIMNIYRFTVTEFLSAGSICELTIKEISESKCELTIECKRVIGAYDSDVEIHNANEHLANLTTYLGELISMDDDKLTSLRDNELQKDDSPTAKGGCAGVILIAVISVATFWITLSVI